MKIVYISFVLFNYVFLCYLVFLFFARGEQILQKKKFKKKLKYLMTKKFINKIFFSVITKNSNWENLTKNLVTFKN